MVIDLAIAVVVEIVFDLSEHTLAVQKAQPLGPLASAVARSPRRRCFATKKTALAPHIDPGFK